ncbi:hypothetical protein L5515_000269 [Caenorhabditis briggsae]|uniref:FAD dependent oxidoreductase n=1 Tax=Caenorhabditis briggsae TaxID=6238 RepID=A0AAE9E115_CAEBR|nr:hypothetical protein L3Y34_014180 [Caenorhabditis briggsae]UMM10554.1 hypothetical protein L5515_000269 [Caenorhabditis briggsae]
MLHASRSLIRTSSDHLHAATMIRNSSTATKHVFACVLGSGVAGSSVAYHLTKRNIKDVLLLERASGVASPTGTSFHSPGLVSASHPAHRYKPILAHSIELYSKLEEETGVKIDFQPTGTIRLATNETRLAEFRKYVNRDYYKEGDVCKTTLLTPDQVRELAPAVDHSRVLGALHTTNDGTISARALTQALVVGAKAGGAQVIDGAIPREIRYDKEKGHWIVALEDGTLVTTRNLINAGGIWANDIARLSGHNLPVVVVEHQYAVLTPNKTPDNTPAIIDHDSTFYVRKSGDDYLFGGFEPLEKTVIREDWYKKGVPTEGSKSIKADFSRLDDAYKRACDLIPSLEGAKIDARAAVFSMTPDGYPLVGPYDKNYWMSTGFLDGVSSGGGIGKYLADWIVDGEPPAELFDTDASRYERWGDRKFFTERSRETYSMYYNWSYTDRLAGRPTDRISGVYGRLKKDGASFSFRNGWEVANSFNMGVQNEEYLPTLIREYEMVTNKCGVIDLSWKGKIEVKGRDAEKLMDYAIASQIPALGKISSGLMLTRHGGILGPMMIFHHDRQRSAFILLTEPERESRDLYWLRRAAAEKQMDVQVSIVSEYLASLALVGPKSREVLSALTKSDVSDEGFPQKSTRMIRLGPVGVVCARSSTSTGQLSFELFHNRAETAKLYHAVMGAGRDHGIVNFGQAALNMMRLEHGYKIWGKELTLDTNPFECGIGSLVDFNKKEFIGRESALEFSKKEFDASSRRLALITFDTEEGIVLDDKYVPSGNEVIRIDGQEARVGQITSGAYNVRLQKPIAFAWIDNSVGKNERLVVDIGDKRLFATSLETPTIPPIQ